LVSAKDPLSAGDLETGASLLARMLKIAPNQFAVRVRLAELHVRQNSINSALNTLRPVQDSNNPRVARLFSVIYLQMHRPREALVYLRKLDMGGRGSATAKRGIALLEMQLGHADEAISVLAEGVAKESTNRSSWRPIDVLLQKRRFADALTVADAAPIPSSG
jgi:predicted Zn-dependent protease